MKEDMGKDCTICDIRINNTNDKNLCKISLPKEIHGQISLEVLSSTEPVIINSKVVEGKVILQHDDIIVISDNILKFASIQGIVIIPTESKESPYHRLRAHLIVHLKQNSSEEDILSCLRLSIPKCSDNDVQSLMNLTHKETTLLTNACRFTKKDLVCYLIDVCKADVNFSEGLKYPALHSAILGRNVEIVEFVLSHGADVSLVDVKGFKPLFHAYAAADDRSPEIIRLLVKSGVDINSAVIKGRGQKLEWRRDVGNNRIEYKEGEVVQVISSYFNHYNGEDQHPLIYNALHNNLDVFHCLIECYEPHTKSVFPRRPGLTPKSISADSFDIFGAGLAVTFRLEEALLFWNCGMQLRFDDDEEKPIYKENVRESRSLFDDETEILYKEDFNELSENPTRIKMFTQALLMFERVLPLYTESYFEAFSVLIDQHLTEGHYKKVLNLHIELQNIYCTAAHSRICHRLFEECAGSIARMLTVLKNPNWTPSFEEKMLVCEQSYNFLHSSVTFHKTYNLPVEDLAFSCCFASIRLIWNLLESVSLEKKEVFQKFMGKLASSDFRNESGQSLLHRAADFDIVTHSDHLSELNGPNFVNNDVLEILLKFGYDPNDIDNEGNTALHFLVESFEPAEIIDEDYESVDILIRYGSHLDSPNKKGKTVIELMKICHFYLEPYQMRSLQCCAASVVVKHDLAEGIEMPDFISKFIKLHQVPT